jgi:hypothetical protein
VQRYVRDWIKAIESITPLAHAIEARVMGGDLDGAKAMLPEERPYQAPSWLAVGLGRSRRCCVLRGRAIAQINGQADEHRCSEGDKRHDADEHQDWPRRVRRLIAHSGLLCRHGRPRQSPKSHQTS